MPKVTSFSDDSGQIDGYRFRCPGCGYEHRIHTGRKNASGAQWTFNGDLESPTFSPSYNERVGPWPDGAERDGKPMGGKIEVCHFHLRNGVCEFLGDCTHDKAGQSIHLKEIPCRPSENL